MNETLKLINTMGEALAEVANQAEEIARLKELLVEAADTLDIVDEWLPPPSPDTELAKQIKQLRKAAK